MGTDEQNQLISRLHQTHGDIVVDIPPPKPYLTTASSNVKAIVLGADPGNVSQDRFEYVFGLCGKDARYFRGIERNLHTLGLGFDDCYVQNLCQCYFTVETSKNDRWDAIAREWVPVLRRELDDLGIPLHVPVLLTTDRLMHVLLTGRLKRPAADYYKTPRFEPPESNALNRHLIPFYRHPRYRLDNWPDYTAAAVRFIP